MTVVAAGAVVFTLTGCGSGGEATAVKLRVVVTTTMAADMASRVAGEHAEVSGMMGPGVDPHLYKATAGDVSRLQQADLILYNGLYLEGRMGDLFVKMGRQGKPVYALAEGVEVSQLMEPPEFLGHYDPHIWFDPKLWVQAVKVVVKALSEADPSHAEIYAANGRAVEEEILSHSEWGLERVSALPKAKRILVTSHDAYNYFGRAFGFQVVGVQGISTVTEAGLADIARTVDFIREHKIKAIFVESSVSPATIKRISEDAGVIIGGELFSDAMGTPGEIHTVDGESYDVGTYEGMFKHNVNTIVEGLK
jgi:manganese/zinc/iron transport system substrate-binding protein